MTIFLTTVHVIVCLMMIVLVLIQRGKGAEIGAVFGGGASSTVFGSRGAGNFLTKMTTGGAIVFMVTSLSLSYLANTRGASSIFDEDAPATETTAPPAGESGFTEVPAPDPAAAPEPGAPPTGDAATTP